MMDYNQPLKYRGFEFRVLNVKEAATNKNDFVIDYHFVAYMARIVPNNPFAFPPSMEVSGIGTTTWKWEVELRLEQQPRVESGTETESNAWCSCR